MPGRRWTPRSSTACCATAVISSGVLGFVLFAGTGPAAAQRASGTTLRIASWNLQHLTKKEAEELRQKQKPPSRAWRNTFGAERRTAEWRRRGAHGIDADVIALQGITSVSDVRRIFPARSHHLVVSRAALAELQGEVQSRAQNAAAGFTAIAIRRRRGLRVAGQRHFLAPALGPALISKPLPGLAVRLNVDRQPIWIASLQFRPSCAVKEGAPPTPDCDAERIMITTVDQWIEGTRASGYSVLAAGHMYRKLHQATAAPAASAAKTSKPAASECAQTPPRIALLKAHDAGDQPDMDLEQLPAPKGRPCAALADLSPIGAPLNRRQ